MRKLTSLLFVLCAYLASPAYSQDLSNIKSFAFQLQNIDVSEIALSSFDLVVMDYSRDGSEKERFTAVDLKTARGANGKLLISYFSIGEAEDYRFYFKQSWITSSRGSPCGRKKTISAPSWLDDSNPNWCGNYKVRYWDKAWQKIVYSYLDKIIGAGFDGIYLDIIDGFEYWKYDKKPKTDRRKSAPKDMAKFVIKISNYARKKSGKDAFVVIPQNGASILDEIPESLKSRYLAAISGIGAEDTFYFGDNDEDNELNPQDFTIQFLDEFKSAGTVIFATDYLSDSAKINDFKNLACSKGYIPQVANRPLDSLTANKLFGCQ